MNRRELNRREFLKSIALAAAGLAVTAVGVKEPEVTGEWHHVAFSYTDESEHILWIDGEVVDRADEEGNYVLSTIGNYVLSIGTDSVLEDIGCDRITLDVDFRVEPGQPFPDRLVGREHQ